MIHQQQWGCTGEFQLQYHLPTNIGIQFDITGFKATIVIGGTWVWSRGTMPWTCHEPTDLDLPSVYPRVIKHVIGRGQLFDQPKRTGLQGVECRRISICLFVLQTTLSFSPRWVYCWSAYLCGRIWIGNAPICGCSWTMEIHGNSRKVHIYIYIVHEYDDETCEKLKSLLQMSYFSHQMRIHR